MSADLELIELAAKAAGETGQIVQRSYDGGRIYCMERHDGTFWMPQHDDGDAIRLAVKLGIEVLPDREISEVHTAFCIRRNGRLVGLNTFEKFATDEMAATRRAIVRAAAEIGKSML